MIISAALWKGLSRSVRKNLPSGHPDRQQHPLYCQKGIAQPDIMLRSPYRAAPPAYCTVYRQGALSSYSKAGYLRHVPPNPGSAIRNIRCRIWKAFSGNSKRPEKPALPMERSRADGRYLLYRGAIMPSGKGNCRLSVCIPQFRAAEQVLSGSGNCWHNEPQ